jgi:hypothetical protein
MLFFALQVYLYGQSLWIFVGCVERLYRETQQYHAGIQVNEENCANNHR